MPEKSHSLLPPERSPQTARAKATPAGRDGHWRIRHDTVDQSGRITLRHAGRLHHIGLGYEHNGIPVRVLVHDLHITVIHADTGEIIRDLTLDTNRDYQPSDANPDPSKACPNAAAARRSPDKQSRETPVNDVSRHHMRGSPGVLFHDLVDPCLASSLTLGDVEEPGHRRGSPGWSIAWIGRPAVRDVEGLGRQAGRAMA